MTPRARLARRLDRAALPLSLFVAILAVVGLALLSAMPCEHTATMAVTSTAKVSR